MTTSSSLKVSVQKFGSFLSGMVMPNIAAFIAWGLITALFIPTGWLPALGANPVDAEGVALNNGGLNFLALVGPMIVYMLPLLIANTGGRLVYGVRGGVVGVIGTMGVIVGTSIPMFMGAMIVGPLGGWLIKKVDAIWAGKIRAGFEMLVDNFSAGIVGAVLALGAFLGIAPVVQTISDALGAGVQALYDSGFAPLLSILVEPAKVLFLNNAINHGVLTPLGTTQAAEQGHSFLFLVEANPGPGLGILLAFAVFGVGLSKASAPGAIIIHFLGGIHEVYFPYVLMKPAIIVAAIAGGATGVATNWLFNSGLRAPASPGSIFAVLLQTPQTQFLGVILSVVLSATVSFLIAGIIVRSTRKADLEAEGLDLASAKAQSAANKGN
ncbi:MAG: system transporter subunit [Actinomycetota bacterium]|jgi:PTS system mannitol-specific IIC component